MNEDVFTDYYFYVGKEISKDELDDIKMNMDISKSYQYALNLVLNKPYSAYKAGKKYTVTYNADGAPNVPSPSEAK